MKILVTGGAGFIGSNLVFTLAERGHKITVVDNLTSGNKKNLKNFKDRFIEDDVSKPAVIEELKKEKFDIIFHEAANTDTTFKNDEEMFRANVDGYKNILSIADISRSAVVYASSAATYGRGKSPMNEDQKPDPLNAYAVSKKMMDDITKEEIKRGTFPIIGLRYFNVYGPRESFKGKSSSMIYQLYLQMKAGKRPRIFKYGEQKRDFIYVKDVVSANIMAMEKTLKGESGIFNVGTARAESFNKLVQELNKNLGTNYNPEYFDNPYGFYQNVTEADMMLSEKNLGFRTEYDIEKGIADYVKYLINCG
ncbi:MAG: ADP-glyceromanno-heptose 6-epimerase [Elusimicrobia bacterium HGW-Elusimicrobia-4]|nr:MAG: ADP-glyceromanno-heptose 6-epimerase [Elusimicrobia bacterium HGW-Elusimicrobia-4]